PETARFDLDSRPAEVPLRGGERVVGDVGGQPRRGTPVAAATGGGVRVVELATQELHPTVRLADVRSHRGGFFGAGLGHSFVPGLVVAPRLPGGDPAALDPAHGTV